MKSIAPNVLGKPSNGYEMVAWLLLAIGFAILVVFFGLLAFHLGWADHLGSFLVLLPIFMGGFFFAGLIEWLFISQLKKSGDKPKTIQQMRQLAVYVALFGILALGGYAYLNYSLITASSHYFVSVQNGGIKVSGLGVPNGQLVVKLDTGIDTIRGANTIEPYYDITGDITISGVGMNPKTSVTHVHHGNLPSNGLTAYGGGFHTAEIPETEDEVRLPDHISPDSPTAKITFVGDVASAYYAGPEKYDIRLNQVNYEALIPLKSYHGSALPDTNNIEIDYIFQCAGLFLLCCAPILLITVEQQSLVKKYPAA